MITLGDAVLRGTKPRSGSSSSMTHPALRAGLTAVLLYSAYADASLVIPALLAGADGLVNKSAPASELYDALRRVARGEPVLPPIVIGRAPCASQFGTVAG